MVSDMIKTEKTHTPAYFKAIADRYGEQAIHAEAYGVPRIVVLQLHQAAMHLRYAAQALEQALKKEKR